MGRVITNINFDEIFTEITINQGGEIGPLSTWDKSSVVLLSRFFPGKQLGVLESAHIPPDLFMAIVITNPVFTIESRLRVIEPFQEPYIVLLHLL